MTMFDLNLLLETTIPEGSVRYENVDICHERIECHFEHIEFYNDIENANCFIIADYSPQHKGYECSIFKGTVIKETNGSYYWWKSII